MIVRRLATLLVATLLAALAPTVAPAEARGPAGPPRIGFSVPGNAHEFRVTRGQTFTVRVTVRNRGGSTARQVRVLLDLPDGVTAPKSRFYLGKLTHVSPGDQRTIAVKLVLDAGSARTVTVRPTLAGTTSSARYYLTLKPR